MNLMKISNLALYSSVGFIIFDFILIIVITILFMIPIGELIKVLNNKQKKHNSKKYQIYLKLIVIQMQITLFLS